MTSDHSGGAIEFLHPTGMGRETGTWSHGALVDLRTCSRLLVVAGQTALAPAGGITGEDDFEAQFRQVYENLERVLAEAGTDMQRVVSFRTFLTREEDVEEFIRLRNERHRAIWGARDFPPNTLVVCSKLALPKLRLEIEAIAVF